MRKKFKEFVSLQFAKAPRRMVLLTILLVNILFFIASALLIYALAPASLEGCSVWETLFYTITMVLDAGCISFIVEDASMTSAVVIIVCLVVVMIGIIAFTGAVIGYITNVIANVIDKSSEGRNRLILSGHTVILNWNTRASEIVNDLLYSEEDEKIVILVDEDRERVEKEIADRLGDTISRENQELREMLKDESFLMRKVRYMRGRLKNRLTIMIREGDTYSTKQLQDISIEQAKAVIILGKDYTNSMCQYNFKEQAERLEQGNTDLIKTLVQVAELTGAASSADDQHIVVEVEDDWTLSIVQKIIDHKERTGKCNITPVAVNRVLGQILSQFSLMPELNLVYRTLFSNKGAAFYCQDHEIPKNLEEENRFFTEYMATHRQSIPLGFLDTKEGPQAYFMAGSSNDLRVVDPTEVAIAPMKLRSNFSFKKKNVIILGHNSKSHYIMEGFNSFRDEWNIVDDNGKILWESMEIMVIDDEENLKKHNYYQEYPQVTSWKEASVYDRETIEQEIREFIKDKDEDTTVLILSDDRATDDALDGTALIYLIYVEEIIQEKLKEDPNWDVNSLDIVVEILNPKNSDVVRSYSIDNVVISNRYVSKMMTQISEKQALFEFYNDILTYDEAGAESSGYNSKEIYAKRVSDFFEEIPGPCSAASLIKAVAIAGPENNKSHIMGYVHNNEVILFDSDQLRISVDLKPDDKLIMYTNH